METCNEPDCNGQLISSPECTQICNYCGAESDVILHTHITPRDWKTEALCNIYSRRKRFKGLLDLLFYPHPAPKDNKMLKYLDRTSLFNNQEALVVAIKKSKLPDKRYCNLHLFCKLYVKDYIKPTVPDNVVFRTTQILRQFDDIEFCFTRLFSGVQFINYRWLLGEILIDHKLTDYLPFVKTLKCKNRVLYYTEMLNKIKAYIQSSERFHTSRKICIR